MSSASMFDGHCGARAGMYDEWSSCSSEDVWERAKRALERDWSQTKYDMSLATGAELNQDFFDTIRQIMGWQQIPRGVRPNPTSGRARS